MRTNYCMLLPGPEAQQLATYIGRRFDVLSVNLHMAAAGQCGVPVIENIQSRERVRSGTLVSANRVGLG
jgi:hypothetical protein